MSDALVVGEDGKARCYWATSAPEYVAYHDEEWGRPVRDDDGLYERLCLEAFQSGLSWLTILRKRDGFRRAFDGFTIEKVAGYGAGDVARLLADVPATTPGSTALAKELKNNGFRFVGPTTAYALMQACGLVDDHLAGCFRRGAYALPG